MPNLARDARPESHLGDHVGARRRFPGATSIEDEAIALEREDRPLRDVADLLAPLPGETAVEGHLADRRHELLESALRDDPDAVVDRDLEPLGRQRPDEVDPPGPRADVREPAGTADAALERVDVDVALGVDLGEREARDVEPATVVEVEHVRLVDHRLVVEPGAALVAGDRHAAEDALLDGQDELVRDPLLPRDPADELADPEAEVADRAARELEERPPGDDLADVERQRRLGADGPSMRAGVVRRVLRDVRLPLVGVDEDVVDQRRRHLHVAHPEAAPRRQLPNLGDDDPAAVSGGHRHRQHLALDGLALHRQVAVLVGGRAADDGHVDREGVEEQPLATAERDDLDEVLGRSPRSACRRSRADRRTFPGRRA